VGLPWWRTCPQRMSAGSCVREARLRKGQLLEHRIEILLLLLGRLAHVRDAFIDLGLLDGNLHLEQILLDQQVVDEEVEQFGPGLFPLFGQNAIQAGASPLLRGWAGH